MKFFDAIIVGTGQAGPALAHRLAGTGQKVAIIERKLFGGTCVNTGCIPTKTLVASAYVAHLARKAAGYGVTVTGEVRADMKALKARKESVLMESRTGVESGLRKLENCTVLQGHARFIGEKQVQVGDEVLSAEKIFINVGGRAAIPELPGIEKIDYLTNASIMELETLPEHLVVVGGSYVGLEFAQMFRRFGSEVTIVEKGPRLVQHEDEDVSDSIREILVAEGIDVRLGSTCIHFDRKDEEMLVGLSCTAEAPEVAGSHVLLAMGRRPNTDDLGLDKARIKTDKSGYIVVDDELRTSADGVWALGDCNGRGGFTHTSYNDFEIVAANLLDNERRRVTDRIQAHALYIDPPLAQVGMTEAEVRKSGRRALIGTRPMSKVGRAVEKDETRGFMKVLVDAESHQILGASILGTGGDEAIHCILDAMYAKAPYTTITHAMHIHPTVSELIPTLLESLQPMEKTR